MQIFIADYVLPISGPPLRRGAVAVDRDKILAVGNVDEIVRAFPDAAIEDFGRAAILPGFVNCHSHLEITAMRGFLDAFESDFALWLLRLNDTRANRLSGDNIRTAALAGAAEGAAAGVTCFADIGRESEPGVEALKAIGLRGIVYQETTFSPDDRTAEADFSSLVGKIDTARNAETELVKIGISPHSPYTVGAKLFSLIADYALRDNLNVSVHAAESAAETRLLRGGGGFMANVYEKFDFAWRAPRCSPVEFLKRTGILETRPLLAHCIAVDSADIASIKASGAAIAHCPKSNAKFGHGWAPLEAFLDAGINVGLGSDSVASNNACDMFDEARFASLAARNRLGSRRFLNAADVLVLATLGGARALGLDSEIGSLDAGKQADITVVSLENIAQAPITDVCASLVFSSSARDVRMTMAAGREIYRDGLFATINHVEIYKRLDAMRSKMAG